MVAKKSEIATVNEIPEIKKYDRNAGFSFSDIAAQADEVLGNDLLSGEILEALERVPFLITHVTFRPSFPDPANKERWMAYVSVEAVIADEAYLQSCGKSVEGKPFRAGEHIVFNDGSTGIYRQVVEYLSDKGYITLPEGKKQAAKGESRYDAPPSEWVDVHYGHVQYLENGPPGFMSYEAEIRLLCPRGLRTSTYENDYGDASTHYIA